ncbi:ABC transporter substrate-binding protein [Microbacterium aurantiacum]|uniref:Sugar ABC transporter substrate-binding protein n=1 Tax=Microbacterium aurantiacum TaxID=162393 RepID=A0ABT8FUL5_9MICO|nr:sugar ABC transporter substrate-binding protein [Microbacterium aurantiacum]MDN4465008.1 sugar ABC transporter substrate-binding protein [Microbacterium aurantiacum]
MAHSNRSKKRILAATGIAAVAALTLAGCSAGADGDGSGGDSGVDQNVTLEFWGWVPGLEDAVAEWNENNPAVQVEFFRMTGDDGDKIPAAIDAGTAPDVVQMSAHSLPGHIINNRLTDLTPYIDGLQSDFTASSWGTVSFGDAVYGVPQDSGPTGLIYRTDIFEEYGIDVPTTWDEYVQAGRDLKAANPDIYLAQFSPNEAGLWMETVWQNEGSFFQIEGDAWDVTVNGPESLEVAELWQTLLDEELVKVVEMWTPEYWAEVNAGTIATINYAAWFPVLLEESAASTAGNWAVADTPLFTGKNTAGESGGSVNVVTANSEHPDEATQFITWLNSSDSGIENLIAGGVFPSAIEGLSSEALLQPAEFFGGQVINEVFAAAAERVPGTWTAGPTHDLTVNALKDEFGRVANGDITFEEALDRVQAMTVAELEAMGLNVAS